MATTLNKLNVVFSLEEQSTHCSTQVTSYCPFILCLIIFKCAPGLLDKEWNTIGVMK